MITYANTNEVEAIAKDLISATNDLDSEFKFIFNRFENVPTVTKEWIGNQADYYFGKVILEKPQYSSLVDKLRQLGNELNAEAANIEERIQANNRRDLV